jgi:uncharacterized membrane protein YvbJ
MKKCPYCGHLNDDNATGCGKCFAGFPEEPVKVEEPKQEVEQKEKTALKKRTRS